MSDNFSISFVFPLKLLNGTPKGEILLRYKSFSVASFNFSKVGVSIFTTSGANKNGVPHPTESIS